MATSPKALARLAGALYVTMAVCAGFAEFFVRSRLIASGDAAMTADNIRASSALFRTGIVVDLGQNVVFLLTAVVLYLLLRQVNPVAAGLMVTFVVISVAIQCLNLLNQYTAWTIATSEEYARVFGRPGADALTLLYANMQHNGFVVAEVFFALWLLPLGYLVIKSGYFPPVLGYLLIAACAGYLADVFTRFLAPGVADTINPAVGGLGAVAELSFAGYLLVRGVRTPPSRPADTPAAMVAAGRTT